MLEIKNLSVRNDDGGSMKDVSVTLQEGEVLAVCGRRVADRSLLLSALVGRRPLAGGYVSIDGELLTALSADTFRCEMAFLPRNFRMEEGTVEELFAQMAALRSAPDGLNRAMLMEQWKMLGIEAGCFGQSFDSLPDSVLQRVMLSLCGVLRRRLVVLDDPAWAQDESGRDRVADGIAAMAGGGAMVVVGCDEATWLRHVDKIVNLNIQ